MSGPINFDEARSIVVDAAKKAAESVAEKSMAVAERTAVVGNEHIRAMGAIGKAQSTRSIDQILEEVEREEADSQQKEINRILAEAEKEGLNDEPLSENHEARVADILKKAALEEKAQVAHILKKDALETRLTTIIRSYL